MQEAKVYPLRNAGEARNVNGYFVHGAGLPNKSFYAGRKRTMEDTLLAAEEERDTRNGVPAPLTIDRKVTKQRIKAATTKARKKSLVLSEVATTDPAVRRDVLRRSEGKSEYSGDDVPFITTKGEFGFQVHHPWGRENDGVAWALAITATEHDEVGRGVQGEEMNEDMKAILVKLYPEVQR